MQVVVEVVESLEVEAEVEALVSTGPGINQGVKGIHTQSRRPSSGGRSDARRGHNAALQDSGHCKNEHATLAMN